MKSHGGPINRKLIQIFKYLNGESMCLISLNNKEKFEKKSKILLLLLALIFEHKTLPGYFAVNWVS